MRQVLLLMVLLLTIGCAGTTVEQQPVVTPEPQVVVVPQPEEELTAPSDYRTDEETWETTDRVIRLQGCEDWKKRDPEADC